MRNWPRTSSLSSYRDLSTLGTLPRSPTYVASEDMCPVFRQRARSLRNPKIELSPKLLRQSHVQNKMWHVWFWTSVTCLNSCRHMIDRHLNVTHMHSHLDRYSIIAFLFTLTRTLGEVLTTHVRMQIHIHADTYIRSAHTCACARNARKHTRTHTVVSDSKGVSYGGLDLCGMCKETTCLICSMYIFSYCYVKFN